MVEQPPKKPGRPPTPADQQATPVRIERRHVAILDELIRDDVSRVFSAGMKAEEEQAQAQGTLPPGETYYLERRVHLATERRRLLGELIEWYRDVYAAARVRILAPFETNDPQRKREVAEWRAKEEARLSEEAPDAVKVALAKNELRRMERDDPEALVRVLRAGRAAEAGDTDDEAS